VAAEGTKPDLSGNLDVLEILERAFEFGDDGPLSELEFHRTLLGAKICGRKFGIGSN
jgi:hypothetical protein